MIMSVPPGLKLLLHGPLLVAHTDFEVQSMDLQCSKISFAVSTAEESH